jgi:EAL domain-containing protein (putative c-di-GMP-specific phosphodiesterase class I)
MAETQDILQYIYNKSSGKIADYPWFEEVLENNKLVSYFQPIVDAQKKPIAYESFVRAELEDGTMASGAVIMQTGAALNIEHALDKFLHKNAIEEFALHKLSGSLSLNFISGFIQLPAKYLEGLSEAAERHLLLPGRVIMDVSKTEDLQNLDQLASIGDYCHERGYEMALDDVKTVKQLTGILKKFVPTYVKIDHNLTANISKADVKKQVVGMIELAHKNGCKVIVEGIESEESFEVFKKFGVEFYQGYYFSRPMAAEEIAKANKAANKAAYKAS